MPSPPGPLPHKKKVSWGKSVDLLPFKGESHKDQADLIAIEVGSGDALRRFTVRKDFLRYGSEHFAEILDDYGKRAEKGPISVLDHDAAVFQVYRNWMYRRQILTKTVEGPRLWKDGARKTLVIEEQRLLIAAYVFADYIRDTDFADAVLDSLLNCAKVENQWPASSLADATLRVSTNALELLLVDLLVFNHDPGDYYTKAKNVLLQNSNWDSVRKLDYLDRLTGRIVAAFAKKTDRSIPPWEDDRCKYHLHGTGRACYADSMIP